jgi:acetyl-CoA carboxylase carboxyl transferase subunit alpha
MAAELKKVILSNIKELASMSPQKRIDQRIDKFCAMGVVVE